jgi:hypothetical protein
VSHVLSHQLTFPHPVFGGNGKGHAWETDTAGPQAPCVRPCELDELLALGNSWTVFTLDFHGKSILHRSLRNSNCLMIPIEDGALGGLASLTCCLALNCALLHAVL